MKQHIATLATLAALGLTAFAPALQAQGTNEYTQEMDEGLTMLTQSVINALRVEGFQTDNVENLTLAQVAEIKGALESGMKAENRSKIEDLIAGD